MEYLGSLGRTGLFDWLLQRLTALLLAVYALFWVVYFIIQKELNYLHWKNLFIQPEMRFITVLVLLSLLIHAWIGIWIVITDYLKFWFFRYFAFALFLLGFCYCFIFGMSILWGH